MSQTEIRIIAAADVAQCISMSEAIELMADAFRALSGGQATVPMRTRLDIGGDAVSLIMPVSMSGCDVFGLKAVSIFPQNQAQHIPLIHAAILLFDRDSGRPVALLDGEQITAIRTGAASGLATRYLSDPHSEVVVVFGAGRQAKTQLQAVAQVRPIRRVYVFNRTEARGRTFAAAMQSELGIPVQWTNDRNLIRQSDVICTATNADQALFQLDEINDRVHINAIGSYRAELCELPIELLAKCRLVVDQRGPCLTEAGEIVAAIKAGVISEADVKAEIGMLNGPNPVGGISVFKSVGNAVQDLAVASRVYHNALERNVGQPVSLR